jgi:actin-related protein
MNWDLVERLWDHGLRDRLRVDPSEHPLLHAEPPHNTDAVRARASQSWRSSRCACLRSILAKTPCSRALRPAATRASSLTPAATSRWRRVCTTATRCATLWLSRRSAAPRSPTTSSRSRTTAASPFARASTCAAPRSSRASSTSRRSIAGARQLPSRHGARCGARRQRESLSRRRGAVARNRQPKRALVHLRAARRQQDRVHRAEAHAARAAVCASCRRRRRRREQCNGADGVQARSIPQIAVAALRRADVDVQRDVFANVVVTGGSSMLPGFSERLTHELRDACAPQTFKLKMIAAGFAAERRFSVWIGGSILASLGTFQQLWISKQEYDEAGSQVVRQKCP